MFPVGSRRPSSLPELAEVEAASRVTDPGEVAPLAGAPCVLDSIANAQPESFLRRVVEFDLEVP